MQKKDHISIPKGNTQRGVYQSVFTYLFKNNIAAKSILDVPAGEGEFLETYLQFFPDSKITGIDRKSVV